MTETTAAPAPTSTDTVIYIPGKIVSTSEVCEPQLRWNGKTLEQAWTIISYGTTGAIEKMTGEWRPVPKKEK